jgi:protein-S-isoprenylcysteine O-methyltransferase Ste14
MNLFILIPGTLLIMVFSWLLSIRRKRYHGIARFFSFESIFIIVLLNVKIWFREPFSMLQIISWILLISSIYFAIAGFILLKRVGKPDSNFENTSVLVKEGFYKYIRHPLYLSLFMVGTGAMLKDPGFPQLVLGAINLVAVWLTARIEEKEMIARFGGEYEKYMKGTKMFIPFII